MAKSQIAIEIIGDNANLRKELADTTRRLKGFERRASQTGKAGGGAFGGMAGQIGLAGAATMGAAKAFSFLKGSIDTTTQLTAASVKLATITKMDAEQSAEWVMLAKSRGMESKGLNTTFITLSKNMLAATNGSKSGAAAFEALGVSQDLVRKGNPNDVMMAVSEGLSKVKNGSERAALAQKLLGRGSQGLIGVMSGGNKKLKAQLNGYKDTAKQIDKNKEATMKLAADKRKLAAALENVKVTLGTALIPFVKMATGALTAFTKLSPGLKKALMVFMLAVGAGVALGKLAKAFQALQLIMAANPILLAVMVIIGLTILIIQHWGAVKKFLLKVWNIIKEKFHQLAEKIKSLAKSGFLGPVGWILTHWSQIVKFFKGLPDRLGGYARSAGSAIWNGLKKGGQGLLGFVKSIANGFIGLIESLVNKVIDGMNTAIKLYNKLPWGDIGLIGKVTLPRFASGGIVNGATIAMIGEAGPEAVIPLSRKYRAQGADLYAKAGKALGMTSGGHTFNITNVGNALDEQQLASRMAWQLSTRSAV